MMMLDGRPNDGMNGAQAGGFTPSAAMQPMSQPAQQQSAQQPRQGFPQHTGANNFPSDQFDDDIPF